MTAQILDRVLRCHRIGDPDGAYPIFDATGSKLSAGRWNTAACPMIYTSEHYSTALLEKFVHGSGRIPPNQHDIEITIPNGLSYEVFDPATLPEWLHASATASKAYGDEWQSSRRSLLLIAPSVVGWSSPSTRRLRSKASRNSGSASSSFPSVRRNAPMVLIDSSVSG